MTAYYERGLYVGECVGQFVNHPEGKAPHLGLRFSILYRVVNGEEHRVERNERTVYLYLTDKAMDMAVDVLSHLGYDRENLRFLDPANENFFNFTGKKCDLWCKIEEWEGDTKEKWSVSLPLDRESTPLDDKELRRLDTLFGVAIKARKPKQATATKPEPAAATAVADRPELLGVDPVQTRNANKERAADDDIPFVWIGWIVALTSASCLWS